MAPRTVRKMSVLEQQFRKIQFNNNFLIWMISRKCPVDQEGYISSTEAAHVVGRILYDLHIIHQPRDVIIRGLSGYYHTTKMLTITKDVPTRWKIEESFFHYIADDIPLFESILETITANAPFDEPVVAIQRLIGRKEPPAKAPVAPSVPLIEGSMMKGGQNPPIAATASRPAPPQGSNGHLPTPKAIDQLLQAANTLGVESAIAILKGISGT